MIGLLSERGFDAEAHATAGPDDAAQLAGAVVAAGADIIISYGGDGTLNEVIQGMAESQTALAVWPGGTSNVVARDLGVPFDVEELADMIGVGRTRRIALGLAKAGSDFAVPGSGFRVPRARNSNRDSGANKEPGASNPEPGTTNSEPGTAGRYFLMMAGIGLDASIARSVNKKL